MALDLKHELETLVEALADASIPFAICGGIAVTIHGAPRLTDDLDLLVPPADIEGAKRAAARVGFDLPAQSMVLGARTPLARTVHRVSRWMKARCSRWP